MKIHSLQSFVAGGWRERSSVLGMLALGVAIGSAMMLPSERIIEYSARAAALRELVLNALGVLGVAGLLKRDGSPPTDPGAQP